MSQAKKVKSSEGRKVEIVEAAPGGIATVLQTDMGKTHINQNVVAKIAGLAVREVEGVHELVPFGTGQRLSSLAAAIGGGEMQDLGVVVEVGEVEAAVDCRIITDYGQSIPRIAHEIQLNVVSRINEMTGLKVKEVNIEVVDLYFEDEQTKVAPSTRVR